MQISPMEWMFLMQQLGASKQAAPGSSGRGERGEAISGATSSSTTSPRGQGPAPTPNTSGIDIPPATGGNAPTTAPYNVAFEGGNPQPSWTPPDESMVPFEPPQFLQSNAGANIPTGEDQIPHETGMFLPSTGENIPTMEGGYPFESQQFLPSEGMNLPTFESVQPQDTPTFSDSGPANVPTNEFMQPTGPNDFLPSAGANVPTNEFMMPAGPDNYLDSNAGANIPTDENMTASLAPDAFRSEDPFEGAVAGGSTGSGLEPNTDYGQPDTSFVPNGTGGYTEIDNATGQAVPTAPGVTPDSAPAQAAGNGATGNFMNDLGSDMTDIGNFFSNGIMNPDVGHYDPAYLSSIGYTPGGGAGSLFPGSNTFVGGAFQTPAGGSIGGPLGTGSAGSGLGSWFARMSMNRLRSGGDPTLGFGMTGGNNARRMLPRSQWGGLNASNASLYSDKGGKPTSTAGITSGGGPGGAV